MDADFTFLVLGKCVKIVGADVILLSILQV